MLLFCPKCGKKMTEEMMSCAYCGAARVNEASVPPLFVDKGGRASAPARKEAAPAVQSSRSLFGKKAQDDTAEVAPAQEKKSLSSMFARKGGDKPAADQPAGKGKHDLSSLFKRKPKDESAVTGRRSVLEDAAVPADTNPFRPMAVGAAGSTAFHVGDAEYAGFWRRFFAAFLDNFIVSILATVLLSGLTVLGFGVGMSMEGPSASVEGLFMAIMLSYLLMIVMIWLYFSAFEASPWQATPGKRLLMIKVCDLEGQRISFLRSTGRYWGKILSTIPLCIGYLMQPFTERKQALHDKLASTLVVKGAQ